MRISDWSSDVCSSDLLGILGRLELDRRGATEPLARVADKAVARNARVEGLSDFDAAGRRVGDEIAAGKTGLAIDAAERRLRPADAVVAQFVRRIVGPGNRGRNAESAVGIGPGDKTREAWIDILGQIIVAPLHRGQDRKS